MSPTTEVRERPILMSVPMVRAVLESRKSQTRRVLKHQPELHDGRMKWCPPGAKYVAAIDEWAPACVWNPDLPVMETGAAGIVEYCPYGRPGDVLWVRETWRGWLAGDYPCVDYKAGGGDPYGCNPPRPGYDIDHPCWSDWKWRPSIFMPRWASRITLEIAGVRVERLQSISEEDAKAEGFAPWTHRTMGKITARHQFMELWGKINTRPGVRWEDDPWCWCIAFRRLEGGAPC